MVDVLDGSGRREAEESARLSATAAQVSAGCLSATAVAAAAAIIAILAKPANDPAGISAELRRLRSTTGLASSLDHDVRSTRNQVFVLLSDAMWLGFSHAAEWRAEAMESPRMSISVDLTDADRAALADYPILGHTTSEIADDLAAKMRWDADAAIAQPLTSAADPQAIPVAMAVIAQQHATRVSGSVGEAYHAGVQAAVRAIGAAMTGAAA